MHALASPLHARRVRNMCVHGPLKLAPHACVDVTSFCSFVLLQNSGFVFEKLNTPGYPVRGVVYSLDRLCANYLVHA